MLIGITPRPTKMSLVQALLASSLFVATNTQALTTIVDIATDPDLPFITSVRGDITIANTGQIFSVVNSTGIVVDDGSRTIIIDPDNINSNAISLSGSGDGIEFTAASSGTLTIGVNSGISVNTGAAIKVDSTVGPLSVIIFNSGDLNTNGATVVDLSGANDAGMLNSAGTVSGNVKLSKSTGSGTLIVDGGTITGTVSTSAGGTKGSSLNISGGTINNIDLTASGKADTITQSGGSIGGILGDSTQAQTLDIQGTVTTGGAITDIKSISVYSSNIFTVNDPITSSNIKAIVNMDSGTLINNSNITLSDTGSFLFIQNGGVFQGNTSGTADFSGQIINSAGTIILQPKPVGTYNLIGQLISQGGSDRILEVEIADDQDFGQIKLTGTGASTITTSVLKIDLTGTGYNPDQATYKIIDNTSTGTVTGTFGSIIQPTSSTLTFAVLATTPDVILQVTRTPLESLVTSAIAQGPASALDSILSSDPTLSDPDMQALIGALDVQSDVNPGLRALAPLFDGATQRMAQTLWGEVVDSVIDHLHPAMPPVPAGDYNPHYCHGGWIQGFGAQLNQEPYQESDGYFISTRGLIVGYDSYYKDRSLMGAAFSYSAGNTYAHAPTQHTQNVDSYQFTAYLSHDFGWCDAAYLDLMAAVAFDQFSSARQIVIDDFASTAYGSFSGQHYGINFESGYRCLFGEADKGRLTPFVRARYTVLSLNPYTETGAGVVGLAVKPEDIRELVTGAGFKLNTRNIELVKTNFTPEFHTALLYDWIADTQTSSALFIAGGTPFVTDGAKVAPLTWNVGFCLSTCARKDLVFSLHYDLDLKSHYVGNTGSVKFKYEW